MKQQTESDCYSGANSLTSGPKRKFIPHILSIYTALQVEFELIQCFAINRPVSYSLSSKNGKSEKIFPTLTADFTFNTFRFPTLVQSFYSVYIFRLEFLTAE